VALTFAAMLGGLAYLPIREATSDLKQSVGIIADKMVTQKEKTAQGSVYGDRDILLDIRERIDRMSVNGF